MIGPHPSPPPCEGHAQGRELASTGGATRCGPVAVEGKRYVGSDSHGGRGDGNDMGATADRAEVVWSETLERNNSRANEFASDTRNTLKRIDGMVCERD